METINVTIWNEFRHEKEEEIKKVYPHGIHECIAGFLKEDGKNRFKVRTATLDSDENHGLSAETLENTDVLIWWGHMAHEEVRDEVVEMIHTRVMKGMGLIALHSAHHSKIFRRLMGTTCNLRWREGDRERVWLCMPGHQIAQGVGDHFELEQEEMYGEYFDIPQPDELIFMGWFKGGEVFRAGCTFHRGHGKIFYFQPGHESYPTFYNESVQLVIKNAIQWAKPSNTIKSLECPNLPAME